MNKTSNEILNRLSDILRSTEGSFVETLDYILRCHSEDYGDYQNDNGEVILDNITDDELLKMVESCWHTMLNG